MIQHSQEATATQTYFIPSRHLAIANDLGHKALTLYLLLKYKLNKSVNPIIFLDVKKISNDLNADPEELVKAIDMLGEYGLLYDEKTSELLCIDAFQERYPAKSILNAHKVLDLAHTVASLNIRDFLIDYVDDCV